MAQPLEDIAAAIKALKDAPARGRVDSNNQRMLEHLAALMRMRDPITAWLEAEGERLALTPITTDLSGEHAVIVARAFLTPVAGRPGPGQPGPVIDKVEAALAGILRETEG
ncbi:hypothetical protein [Streptomyces cylindrosporus]|uniref:Uncharacterized protein n=1 Tax=Streptomyces cylindrosporus TaxID=2927583 RepID=A0ABS9YJY9_9ACTN|nr:hypothetical protein [Streptomyces cylindrosporus]MCI3277583.1 hypothetical protein [Streptomyces cylindrosporus]